MKVLLMVTHTIYIIFTLTAKTYTKSLLGSATNGHSYSLYRVLTLMAKPTQSLS